MPIVDGKNEKPTLVFDSWADVGNGALAVTWETALDAECMTLLRGLSENLNYLGRSESWVEARVLDDGEPLPYGGKSFPASRGQRPGPEWEQVSLVAAAEPEPYLAWRELQISEALAQYPLPAGKKKAPKPLEKKRAQAVAPYPIDLIDALQWDTARWRAHSWSDAPGSRRVHYWRRSDALEVARLHPPKVRRRATTPSMLLALSTASGRRGGLPSVTRALPQAELVHRALVGRLGTERLADCPVLTGKDVLGRPLRGHRHAYVFPLDLDGDGLLDHILIHARMGLDDLAQRAIRGLRWTHTKGASDLQVALAAFGEIGDLASMGEPFTSGLACVFGPARTWRSVTPFVPPRFIKPRGPNALEGQVAAELASQGLPSARVEVLPWTHDEARTLRHHVRVRRDARKGPPADYGLTLRLEFESELQGPLALGYASHFGLGRFEAADF